MYGYLYKIYWNMLHTTANNFSCTFLHEISYGYPLIRKCVFLYYQVDMKTYVHAQPREKKNWKKLCVSRSHKIYSTPQQELKIHFFSLFSVSWNHQRYAFGKNDPFLVSCPRHHHHRFYLSCKKTYKMPFFPRQWKKIVKPLFPNDAWPPMIRRDAVYNHLWLLDSCNPNLIFLSESTKTWDSWVHITTHLKSLHTFSFF